MKGIFKGLKYFTQIFEDDEKEEEIQIGLPTDVKHVAHIGTDGPSSDPPSWMKDFKQAPESQVDSSSVVSGDESKTGNRKETTRDMPKSSKKDPSSIKSRRRRNHSKDSADGSLKSATNDSGCESPANNLPPADGPKKTTQRRKARAEGASTRPRTKAATAAAEDGGGAAADRK